MENTELEQLLDMSECGIFKTRAGTDMELLYANARFYEILQYTPEEFEEKFNGKVLETLLPEDKQKIRNLIARQRAAGGKLQLEFRAKRKNGLIAWVSLSAKTMQEEGEPIYYCSCMDITQTKRNIAEVYQAKRDAEMIANNIPGGVIKVRMTDFKLLYANNGFFRLAGYSKEEYLVNFGNHVDQVIHPLDIEMVQKQVKTALANRGLLGFEYRVISKTGEVRWSYVNGCRIDDDKGQPVYLCVIMDITDRKKLERELGNIAKRSDTLSKFMRQIVWTYDIKEGEISFNGELSGGDDNELNAEEGHWRRRLDEQVHPDEQEAFRRLFQERIRTVGQSREIYRVKNWNGEYRRAEIGCISISEEGTETPDYIFGMTRILDYSDPAASMAAEMPPAPSKHLEGKLVQMAKGAQADAEDSLTNLQSYHQFLQQAEEKLNHRKEEDHYAFFCADIDEFHKFGSSYGYSLSTELLKQYSGLLHEFLIYDGLCSRVDGDYFVGMTSYKDYKELVQTLSRMLSHQEQMQEQEQISYNTTIGLYMVNPEDHELSEMLERADLARRSIKGIHDNTYAIYTEELQKTRFHEEDTIQQIWKAMKSELVDICYLPRIKGSKENIIGCKAITRVQMRDGRYLESDALQRYIERGGILKEVAFYTLRHVCSNIGAWKAKGNDVIPFAVEVTARQLSRKNAVAMIDDIVVRQNKLKPSDVIFELPERYFDNMTNALRKALEQICQRGYQVVISRFGADHTAVHMLRELPVTGIKFHGEYFEHMTSERERIILSSIVEMAGKLGLTVCCGGIHTKLQEEYARSLGIEELEGEMFYGAMRNNVFEKCFLTDKSKN